MDQYLLIPCLGGWTSIYQLFWCSPRVQGFDTLPYKGWWWLNHQKWRSMRGSPHFWGPSVDAGMNGMAWSENQSLPSYPISILTSVGSYSWVFGGPKVIQIWVDPDIETATASWNHEPEQCSKPLLTNDYTSRGLYYPICWGLLWSIMGISFLTNRYSRMTEFWIPGFCPKRIYIKSWTPTKIAIEWGKWR